MTFTLGGKKSQFKEVLVLFVPTILLVGILEIVNFEEVLGSCKQTNCRARLSTIFYILH